jgi:hypothetical protein
VFLLHALEHLHAVAPDVAHRDPGLFGRISWPSADGLRPSSAVRIAFSTAPAKPRSQTWTVIIRGSGTPMVATWLSGIAAP